MITDTFLDQIQTIVSRAGLTEQSVAALREAFPDYHFTHCLDDDLSADLEPARASAGFNLYLIDSSQHCIRFTQDQHQAKGLVLAEVEMQD
jgi:hypothetical protein